MLKVDPTPLSPPSLRTGSQILLDCLVAEGVEVIFGYPGGAIMPVYDALYDYSDTIRHVLVRHEQGAAHAAEGYARASHKVGVCLATSGPGATNLVTGIADAMLDSVPIVCITGQVPSTLLGTDAFQETDIIGITSSITKWSYQITSPDEIADTVARAFEIASSGRPGPVLIDITKDAQIGSTAFSERTETKQQPSFPRLALQNAASMINASERPMLLIGHGVLLSKAEKEILQLAQRAGLPTAWTLHAVSAFPSEHPLAAGMLGMHGNYAPNKLTNEADLLIAVGMRFDDRVTGRLKDYAKKASIIHIDIDPSELQKILPTAIAIRADAKYAISQLLHLVESKERPEWLQEFRKYEEIENEKIIRRDTDPKHGPLRMGEVISQLSTQSDGAALVVADVGQHQMFTARYYRFTQTNSFFSSGGLGTMGFAVPAAMGAAFAQPDRTIIAVVGDGGFQMTMQELGAIAQQNLNVKILILNNNFLGMVRQWQQLFFDRRYSSVEMQNPDFGKIAQAFSIPGERVTERADLPSALQRMLSTPGPFLLEAVVAREDNVFPMVPSGSSVSDMRLE